MDLKALAQVNFNRDTLAKMDSPSTHASAARTVYHHISSSEPDVSLKQLLALAWVMPGRRRVKEKHFDQTTESLLAVPEFLLDIQVILMAGFPSGENYPSFDCPECDEASGVQDHDFDRMFRLGYSLECEICRKSVSPEAIHFGDGFSIAGFWTGNDVRFVSG